MPTEEKFICYYPIFYLPPNEYHFNSAQLLGEKEYIASVVVLIPKVKDPISQQQCIDLFEAYQRSYTTVDITVEACHSHNAFAEVYDRLEAGTKCFIALDEQTARSAEFNEAFAGKDQLQIELIAGTYEGASKAMLQAIKDGNKHEFFKYIPESLSDRDKADCWRIVHPSLKESITDPNYWKTLITENFQDHINIFNEYTTGMPNYDAMIDRPSYYYLFKNRDTKLVWMTPRAYLEGCAKYVHNISLADEYKQIKKEDIVALMDVVKAGKKIDTPVLNIADKSQEGRHRSVVAEKIGMKKIPVWVIYPVKEEKKEAMVDLIETSDSYEVAEHELKKHGIKLDHKTFEKVKWKEFKQNLHEAK